MWLMFTRINAYDGKLKEIEHCCVKARGGFPKEYKEYLKTDCVKDSILEMIYSI